MTVAALDTLSRYVSPINPAVFPHLTLVLLGIGLFFTAWFFVYEVAKSLKSFADPTLMLPGDLDQVHEGVDQGAGHLRGGQPLHGLWHPLPPPLGWNLCLGAPQSLSKHLHKQECQPATMPITNCISLE